MAIAEPAQYTGRFAPSPTGPLHFGSLLAAVASYLQARVNAGRWLLRVEDIDPPRQQPGAVDAIIAALEAYGFQWHGPVLYQSHSTPRHAQLLQRLIDAGQAYPCSCSRRDLAEASQGPLGAIYPGTCRHGHSGSSTAIRVLTDNSAISFIDALQGRQSMALERECGDFIVRRRDGLIAYHLAVVVDDADQGISEVVRGIDLLDSTPRQIHLQRLLGLPSPAYLHIPVIENERGQKLSKLTGAQAIPTTRPGPPLVAALAALGQQPPPRLAAAPIAEIWSWAVENWRVQALAGQQHIPSAQDPLAEAENGLS
ncbi:MAG: tRNA glutamyl-Q(34) synthetase GluQRS [Gammaproteobacteria bacterium]|nr:MAG: tRNA glutamyl-Q(34) synthetase GluQRS [Gammaproteobacteria bacterium]